MKTKGYWVIKTNRGGYYCGNSRFDSQLRNAQIYVWKEKAKEAIEVFKKRELLPAEITYEIVAISEPKELADTEAEWQVSGTFDDFLKCSNCGESWPWAVAEYYLFCPCCGKHMTNHQQEDN